MTPLSLTKTQARQFLLAYQHLWPPRSLHGKAGALAYMHRVRCIQFDPLDITGQNAELVLQSRLADFTPAMLRELLYTDRLLLDGWDKNMAIYPLEDWPYFRRRRTAAQTQLRSSAEVQAIAPQIRAAIETRGPLSSLELDFNQSVDWYWAPTRLARAALESLYFSGDLVIHHKVHTRKVYDLVERHVPAGLLHAPEPHPEEAAYHDWYLLRRIGSIGLMWNFGAEAWLGTPFNSPQRKAAIERLLARGELLSVRVESLAMPLYLRTQDRPLLEEILADSPPAAGAATGDSAAAAALLAPLDNLLWERRLLKELFDFEYRWEVYKPAAQRQYGYYVLPVLYGDRFIARCEPVRSKKHQRLSLKNWWWEPGVTPTPEMHRAIAACLQRFALFLGVEWDPLPNPAEF